MAHALDGIIVEVDMSDLDVVRERIGIDCETVVLRGNGNSSGAEIFDGLVAAAVSEFEFERFSAISVSEQLVAKADTEGWELGDELFDFRMDIIKCGWISRAVGEEKSIGFFREDFFSRSGGGHDLNLEACLA